MTGTPLPSPEPAPAPAPALPLFPEPAPPPVPGCDICGALDRQRAEARAKGDLSFVADCNAEIRSHPHGTALRP
jgi:hypothetical protein